MSKTIIRISTILSFEKILDAKTALTTANMTEHGRVGKLTEPQKVILKQMDKNMKDIKKIRKMLQQKDKIQKLERYTSIHHTLHTHTNLHILYRNQIVFCLIQK